TRTSASRTTSPSSTTALGFGLSLGVSPNAFSSIATSSAVRSGVTLILVLHGLHFSSQSAIKTPAFEDFNRIITIDEFAVAIDERHPNAFCAFFNQRDFS